MIVEVAQNVQMKAKVRHAAGKFYAIRMITIILRLYLAFSLIELMDIPSFYVL